jgi:hypothetical protein
MPLTAILPRRNSLLLASPLDRWERRSPMHAYTWYVWRNASRDGPSLKVRIGKDEDAVSPPTSAFGTTLIGLFPRPPTADRRAASPRLRAASLPTQRPSPPSFAMPQSGPPTLGDIAAPSPATRSRACLGFHVAETRLCPTVPLEPGALGRDIRDSVLRLFGPTRDKIGPADIKRGSVGNSRSLPPHKAIERLTSA